MAKKTRKEISVMVATVAQNMHRGPKIDAAIACSLLADSLFEGQGSMSQETFGAAIGGIAYLLLVAEKEAMRTMPVCGTA